MEVIEHLADTAGARRNRLFNLEIACRYNPEGCILIIRISYQS
jgi:hypothetical protein